MNAPVKGTWESNGLTLAYRSWGDGPLMLIHHGFLDHSGSWAAVAERLADKHRVVAVDARGHGDSEWIGAGGAYYFSDYILDLRGLLEQLGDPEVILVGHSMGSGVVGYYAGAYPDKMRGVALVEGLGPPQTNPKHIARWMRDFVSSTRKRYARREPIPVPTVEEAAARMRAADPFLADELSLTLARAATRPVRGGVVWKFDPLHRARIGSPFNLEWAKALWAEITSPVLVVTSETSPFKQADHAERMSVFQNAREVVIPGVGHNLHAHDPGALAAALQAFSAEL